MNNDTSNRSTPATASPLTVKEAAPPVMIKKIGKTTYRVKIHFSETSKETMSDKIKRLILNDSEKSSYGLMLMVSQFSISSKLKLIYPQGLHSQIKLVKT